MSELTDSFLQAVRKCFGKQDAFHVVDGVLTGYEPPKPVAQVVIPDYVKEIDSKVFMNHGEITSVIIPESVSSIGAFAFSNCINLQKVQLPENLTKIGENAFTMCRYLEEIHLPETLQSIGKQAFRYCSTLKEVIIPKDIVRLEEGTFSGCTDLKKVVFPENLAVIGAQCFSACRALCEMKFPYSLVVIGAWAFDGCTEINPFTIPPSVKEIESQAFGRDSAIWLEEPDGHLNFHLKQDWDNISGSQLLSFLHMRMNFGQETKIPLIPDKTMFSALLVYLMKAGRSDEQLHLLVRQNSYSIALYLLEENDPLGMALLLEHAELSPEETDRLIEQAIQHTRLEIQIQLSDWKEKRGYYLDPKERLKI